MTKKKTKKRGKDPKQEVARVLRHLKSALGFLGVAAEIAANVAPLVGANKKTQADLEKARQAGEAARKLSEGINKALER